MTTLGSDWALKLLICILLQYAFFWVNTLKKNLRYILIINSIENFI